MLAISALAACFGISMCALYITSKMYPLQQQTAVHVKQSAALPTPGAVPVPTSRVLNTLFDFEHSEFCQRFACREDKQWIVRNGDKNHAYLTNLGDDVDVEVQDNSSRQPPLTGLGIMFFNREQLSAQDFEVINTLVRSTNESTNHAKTMAYIAKNIETDINCRTCQMEDSPNFITDGDFHVWAHCCPN